MRERVSIAGDDQGEEQRLSRHGRANAGKLRAAILNPRTDLGLFYIL